MTACGSDRRDKATPSTSALEARLSKLRSVPYTSVTEESSGEAASGVTVHDEARAFRGYNLFCSRIDPEVLLLDMSGRVVHSWRYSFQHEKDVCEHAILLPNGDVIIVDKFNRLLKLDWNSNIVWSTPLKAHHDVCLTRAHTLYAIAVEGLEHRGLVVRFPIIVELDANGKPGETWSAYDHLDELKQRLDRGSFLDTILDSMLTRHGQGETYDKLLDRDEAILRRDMRVQYDHFHMNTIGVVPDTPLAASDGAFALGNLLICFRNVNQVAILEKETKEVLWAWGEGYLELPHHPTMLDNGNILIFDNGVLRKYSRVLELDPLTLTVVWEYVGDPPDSFYSPRKGSAQRLSNGNTLICEGDRGRAFEVTAAGEIVWDWFNPLTKNDHRVQVYRMMRYAPEYVEPLLRAQ